MSISAKFKVQRVTKITEEMTEVELVPGYAGGKNAEWSKWTPSGVIRMNITNPAALEQLTEGKAFTILFEAEGEEGVVFAKPSIAEEYNLQPGR